MHWEDLEHAMPPTETHRLPGWKADYTAAHGGPPLEVLPFLRWLHDTQRMSGPMYRAVTRLQGRGPSPSQADTIAETTFFPDDLTESDHASTIDLPETLPPTRGEGPPYTLEGRLAAGAMGEILIVKERDLKRRVALKRMHPNLANKPRLMRRFLHEAQITAQLDHPNIVPVYNLLLEEGALPCYTMKLVQGKTFADLIGEARQRWDAGFTPDDDLSLKTLLDHFSKACDAIAYAHSRGVVHRDLKPENIMVGAYGEVYVMDWGIARIMGSREVTLESVDLSDDTLQQTRVGAILGTPAYMSPEQAMGRNEELDARSDIYSLGLILTELATLRAAVKGRDTQHLMKTMKTGLREPLLHHRAGVSVSPALIAIIDKAAEVDPLRRYRTADELSDDVRRFIQGEPVHAYPEPFLQRTGRWMAIHRSLAVAALVGVLAIAAGITITSLGSTLYTVRLASFREASLSHLQSTVAAHASLLDVEFSRLEGRLNGLAGTALQALAAEPTPEGRTSTFFLDMHMAPDLAYSAAYDRPISLRHPNFLLPRSNSLDDARPAFRRLATMDEFLRDVLTTGRDEHFPAFSKAQRYQALTVKRGPVRWVHLALDSGLGLSFPGDPAVPPDLDLRQEPWFLEAEGTRPVWGDTHRPAADDRSLLPVSKPIYDEDGWRIGVVGLEIDLEEILSGRVRPDELHPDVHVFVLDENGNILFSTRPEDADVPDLTRSRWIRRQSYDDDRVLDVLDVRSSGYLELTNAEGDTDLVIFNKMGAMGWTYMVRGPQSLLMH